MPRLFTALELPQIHRSRLQMLQTGLKGVRWVEPSDMHITLRFIGDVSPSTAQAIVEGISSHTWKSPKVSLGEIKVFGNNKPKSVYASVKADQALSNLASGLDRLMRRLGLPADNRKFTPHVTLARCRPVAVSDLAAWLASHGGFSSPVFIPAQFMLYSAQDSIGGGPYIAEHSWHLTPPS